MQTSDSVASFLDLAKQQRLLHPDEVDGLFRDPDALPENLATVCDRLERRGVLTKFQAELVRSGRWTDLNFGGYPVTHEIGPCVGGTAFGALHPSLRTPVILRRLRPDWLAPSDNVSAYIQRAQTASTVSHPNLIHLLDAGVFRDDPFVTLDPFDGADLETLIRDIGPMPASLAAGYARQIAFALSAAHERGVIHGHVRPASVQAGPLVPMGTKTRPDGSPKLRPAATAVVKLFELGLTPHRPALTSLDPAVSFDGLGFLPPERATDGTPTAAGDVYGLGATLFFLLTGKPPVSAETVGEWLATLESVPPVRLEQLRPDAPAALLAAVAAMLSRDPAARPTADAAGDLLSPNPPPVVTVPTAAASPVPAVELTPESPAPVESPRTATPEPEAEVILSAAPSGEEVPEALAAPDSAVLPEADSIEEVELVPEPPPLPKPHSLPGDIDLSNLPLPTAPVAYNPPPVPAAFIPPAAPLPVGYPPPAFAPHPVAYAPPPAYAPPHAAPDLTADAPAGLPVRREVPKSNTWMIWLGVGAVLQIIGVLGWLYLAGIIGGSSAPEPPATKSKSSKPKKPKSLTAPKPADPDE